MKSRMNHRKCFKGPFPGLFQVPRLMCLLWGLFLSVCPLPGEAGVFYYTHGKANGGVARIAINDETGQWLGHQALPGPSLDRPKKLAVMPDGAHLVVTSDETDVAWFYSLGGTPQFRGEQKLEGETSDLAVTGDQVLLSASDGLFHCLSPRQVKITRTWNAREAMSPPGSKGEHILLLPDQQTALISFQKDGKKGKSAGNRLMVFDLKRFAPRYDLPLPRDHPELHIAGSPSEQGPSPEMIFAAPKCHTVAISLDLYGALAFADLDALLKGEWKHLEYLPTSLDGTWGTAFPDRGLLFESGGKERLLISNASDNGGLVLVDMAARKITQRFPCKAGAENPVWLGAAQKLVTVISGKVKSRGGSGLNNEIAGPGKDLLVFDLAPLESGEAVTLERIAFESPVTRVESVSGGRNQILLLLCGEEGGQEWIIYDLATRTTRHREAAKGIVSRIDAWRPGR